MPADSPAVVLRHAAHHIRQLAAKATPGPWTLWDRGVGWEINELPDTHDGTTFREPDARWIAAMGPQLAEPLAAWLDDVARLWNHGSISRRTVDHAVTIARAVLATAPTQEKP
ncbi:hypothetical protein ABZ215_24900 [Amycolatopsis sp. NPDC006131]|uniref:hypothetical protein n=1 Tax=Amycolatopsis sp. NPDC006131 TaxID=3156731 RepID=UPI0033B2C1FD